VESRGRLICVDTYIDIYYDGTMTRPADALTRVASALRDLAAALEALASAEPTPGTSTASDARVVPVDADVARLARLLYNRLGEGNRDFVRAFALEFEPGEAFYLEDIARAAKVAPATARARLMNIGRSLKALGGRDLLWETDWMEDEGLMTYEWTYEGHKAVMQEFGG
jgi:hypothetical protein